MVKGYISTIVYDVWDTYDQSTKNTLYPRDRVSGYSIGNLYYALRGAYRCSWRSMWHRFWMTVISG